MDYAEHLGLNGTCRRYETLKSEVAALAKVARKMAEGFRPHGQHDLIGIAAMLDMAVMKSEGER